MHSPVFRTGACLFLTMLTGGAEQWSAKPGDGTSEGWFGETRQLVWRQALTENPPGGEKYRNNAFFHPLATPSGFVWTDSQPRDHGHHSGLWWPWKYVEVDGKRYVTWEIQHGEGAHVSRDVKVLHAGPDYLEWELHNETVIRKRGKDAGRPVTDGIPVIRETARVRLARMGEDANVLDLWIGQEPLVDGPVRLPKHRYSGFTWRGPKKWNAKSSKLTTSEGHERKNANGKIARWTLMTGPTETDAGEASVLILSAAADIAGQPERLRVWNAIMHGGVPFINFNPVVKETLTLHAGTPAVATRQYRVIAADRKISAEEAERLWRDWRGK